MLPINLDSSKQIAFASDNALIDTTKDKEIQLKELVKKQNNAELASLLITSSEQTKLDEINKKYKIDTTTIPFKIRDGMPIGCKVTLRGDRMYEFLQRLISIAIPRERDFRGLEVKSFDGRGNYSMGIKEHIIFPEIDYDKVDKIRGMDICISTTAGDDKSGEALLRALKFPFKT